MDICVDNANRAIFNAANANPQYAGMGTTLVLAVFREEGLLLGHVGETTAAARVDKAVDPAPFRNRFLCQGVALVRLGHIAGHSNGIATSCLNIGSQCLNCIDRPR